MGLSRKVCCWIFGIVFAILVRSYVFDSTAASIITPLKISKEVKLEQGDSGFISELNVTNITDRPIMIVGYCTQGTQFTLPEIPVTIPSLKRRSLRLEIQRNESIQYELKEVEFILRNEGVFKTHIRMQKSAR